MNRAKRAIERTILLLHLHDVPPFVRRVIVAVIGSSIFLVGIAMIVLPGPAVVVIPFGLAILATEFIWANRWLRKARALLQKAKEKTFEK